MNFKFVQKIRKKNTKLIFFLLSDIEKLCKNCVVDSFDPLFIDFIDMCVRLISFLL